MIRSLRLVLAVVVAVSLAAACGSDKPSRPPAAGSSAAAPVKPAPPPVKPAPAPPAVEPYQDETFGFAVEAARKPTTAERQVPTAVGTVTAHTYVFSAPSAPGAMLVAVTPSFYEDGDLDVKRSLDDGQQGMLATIRGTLVDSSDLELDGAPGRGERFVDSFKFVPRKGGA